MDAIEPTTGNYPVLHPAYKQQLERLLRAFDALSIEDRALALAFLGIWAAREKSANRVWENAPPSVAARVLGEQA